MSNKYNPDIHHRRSIRLKNYDYSQAGAYYVTICTEGRECLFGEVVDGKMVLNDGGQMVQAVWSEMPVNYSGVEIDQFIAMPNHIHGIIVLLSVGAGPCACPVETNTEIPKKGQPRGVAPTTKISLPDAVHHFKSFTTTKYRIGVDKYNWHPFPGKFWQRNYYEHIIHNEDELNRIREYIIQNPAQWDEDVENPNKK